MSQNPKSSGAGRPNGEAAESSAGLSRADLAMLLTAERRLSAALSRPAEVLRFFLTTVEEAASLLRVDRAVICITEEDDPNLLRIVAGTGPMAADEGEILPVDGSFEGRVLGSAEPVRSRDLGAEPEPYHPRHNPERAGPALGVSLRLDGNPVGVLLAARERDGVPFLERDAELLREFSVPVSAGIQAIRRFDTVRRSREAVDAWNREQALKRWVAVYQALSESRGELVFRLHPSGRMEWGGSTEALYGVRPAHFAPRIDDLLEVVVPTDVDGVRAAIEAVSAADGTSEASAPCGLLANGTVHARDLRVWRLPGELEVVGIIGGSVQRALGGGLSEASEGVVDSVIRALRHQINNPLAAVIGRAQLLIREDQVQADHTLRQAVETILFESERINRFVQQLESQDAVRRLTEPLPGEE